VVVIVRAPVSIVFSTDTTMFSPASLEAQRIITLSINKLNAVRVTRTGTSMCKSLFVTNLLNEAKKVYYEEEQERAERYAQCRAATPQVTVTPVCPVSSPVVQVPPVNNQANNNVNRVQQCYSGSVSSNTVTSVTITTTTTVTSMASATGPSADVTVSRKRRRVSEQETADAVSSILPKRLRSELAESSEGASGEDRLSGEDGGKSTEEDATSRVSDQEDSASSEDSDSDGEESASDTSASSSGDEMEVDRITSLVSYFTFAKSKNRSDFCSSPIHQPHSSQILALTA